MSSLGRYGKRVCFKICMDLPEDYSRPELIIFIAEAIKRYNMLHRIGIDITTVKVEWPCK